MDYQTTASNLLHCNCRAYFNVSRVSFSKGLEVITMIVLVIIFVLCFAVAFILTILDFALLLSHMANPYPKSYIEYRKQMNEIMAQLVKH